MAISKQPNQLIFPANLRNADGHRVCIHFSCLPDRNNTEVVNIWFPCPSNLLYTDGARYGDVEIGNVVSTYLSSKAQGGGVIDASKKLFGGVSGFDVAKLLALRSEDKTGIFTEANVSFAARQVTNPRTNTSFEANQVRSFEFSFACIARSQAETETLRNINSSFRRFTYAKPYGDNINSLSLAYPPIWEIKFMDLKTQTESQYVPKIFKCFLESFSTNINPSSNTWHAKDGSPFQIDMSCVFREVKVLTRDDIDKLDVEFPNRSYAEHEAFGEVLNKAENAAVNSQRSGPLTTIGPNAVNNPFAPK